MRYSQQGERGMIRFAAAAIIFNVFMGACVFAQDTTPKVEVFGGYSLLRSDRGGLTGPLLDADLNQPSNPFAVPTYFLDGWSAEGQYNTSRWLGIAVDAGGRYGSPISASGGRTLSGLPKETSYSVMVGPVISYRTKSRLTPFAHALFGWNRTSLDASTITGSVSAPISVTPTSYDDFVMAAGAGVDCKITRRFSIRLGQAEWYHTSVNLGRFYTNAFGGDLLEGLHNTQVNYRVSAGAVVQF
jgi:opacity protein-like surface antigen